MDVRRRGTYEIALRRWPEETGYALADGIDGDDSQWRRDAIKGEDAAMHEDGVAIDIQWAQLSIGGQTLQTEIASGDDSALFTLELEAGETQSSPPFTTAPSAASPPTTRAPARLKAAATKSG